MYPQVFGKYVLERELSRGGMARVVLATLRGAGGFEKRLVVKQIRDELSFDQQFVRRFVEEAKTTVALSHPNIVPVYELGVEQGTYFLAMELVEGASIAELVRDRNEDGSKRVLSPEEGAYVGMEVCRALDYAHRRMKVVHRDITPRNVMLDEEGQVKLIDFGIAAPALVAGHEILGSPGHMPPEQVEGDELGPPTDIFALAVLLMEAWTGVAPFRRATPEECDAAMHEPHPKPSDYNPRLIPLDDVIVRAMKLDPKERQQDANELGRALRAFLQGTDVTDIARELGDRVRNYRENAAEPSPRSVHGQAMRATNPSVGDLGTKTFAAREEAIRWSQPPASEIEPPAASTRRLDPTGSDPPPYARSSRRVAVEDDPGQPSTRQLARNPDSISFQITPRAVGTPTPISSVATPAAVAVSSSRQDPTEKRPAYSRKEDPAMSIPTPFMVETTSTEVLRAAQLAATAPPQVLRPRDPRTDTLTTSGLETGMRDSSAHATPSSRTRIVAMLAAAAVVLVGVGYVFRNRTPGKVEPTPVTALTDAGAVAVTSAAPNASAPIPPASAAIAVPASAAAVTTARAPTSSTNGVGSGSAPTAAAEKAGKALVRFLGDPGTSVSVDGSSRGSTPVTLNLDPGQHDVRFMFGPTGESRGERFNVKASEKVTVRAEFTGASPTVRIQR